MNPEQNGPPLMTSNGDFLGHIPRKKSFTAAAAVPAAPASPAPVSLDAPIPRKAASAAAAAIATEASSTTDVLPSIPRKNKRPKLPSAESTKPRASSLTRLPATNRIRVVSEQPLVLSIKTSGMSTFVPDTQPTARARSKRIHASKSYQELEDTDNEEDYIMTPEEEERLLQQRAKKRRKKLDKKVSAEGDETAPVADEAQPMQVDTEATNLLDSISPPPGTLSTLFYSRECYNHIFVLEKVCGWKTRPVVQLVTVTTGEGDESPKEEVTALDPAEAAALQQKVLLEEDFFADAGKRMEVSRINAARCPVMMALAAEIPTPAGMPKRILKQTGEREEVLLIKWRGRSHLHCSWERSTDLQRLDPTSNSGARAKIRRFWQNQEVAYGPGWKSVLEEERKTTAAIHSHGAVAAASEEELVEPEEFFSPQCLEIERVLACDENEMNMQIFAKQRAYNLQREEKAEERKEEVEKHRAAASGATPYRSLVQKMAGIIAAGKETPWDPEDNVRYVVKWKGLPYAEITWEYWRDIKLNAVDEAEDFWYRQEAPDVEEATRRIPHPHVRDFKKLQESPEYGITKRGRPVADMSVADGNDASRNRNDMATEEEENDDAGFKLRSYQLEGVNWLLFNWWNRRSCILADEMGLGKTIQSAAFLQELQSQPAAQVRGPFLIVAPLSLITQWQTELHSWAPDMNAILYHGSADARDFLVQNEFYYTDQFLDKPIATKLKRHHVTKFHVLITTYEVALKDISVLSKIRWRVLIVDEAHRLKNPKARLFAELASVPREYCLLLTGTPIANATEELWALLNFANPRTFDDKDGFLEKFGEMTDVKQVNELHSLLKPYLLRRVKENVEKSLPPREETILEVSLTPIQKKYYKAIYERNTNFLFKGATKNNTPSLMNVMMELRKCCNHPYLVKGAEDRILQDAAAKLKDKKDEHGKESPVDYLKLFEEQLVKSSGKMVLMEKLLQKLFAGGHKVLIFSQMVRVLDLLEELLKLKKYRYERLDGTTSSSQRLHAVDRFKRKSCKRFVMLLSTRAGGLGLNLTAADIVIIFDSDWNPQNDLQAMARAHRIGQTRAVRVYRLLTAKTYEMHMFHSASLKLGLERAVLSQNRELGDESDDNNKSKKKSERAAQAKEIDELLKKGAYDVFRDEDDTEAEKFMETDIDQLLESSSKKITYGATATSSLGSGLGSFSKASFVANTDDGEKDVDLDDPEFWSKAVGLEAPEETPDEVAQMIDDGVKRSRKQVQVYDPYAEIAEAEERRKEVEKLEKMLEREEKERLKKEKQLKKQEAKEKKKRERQEKKMKEKKKAALAKGVTLVVGDKDQAKKIPKLSKELKPAKTKKKNQRQRALIRAENENPTIERLRQAWEVPQRNRATSAMIRFGFGRFCKVRSESSLSSLPLQDLETFARSYIYQLSLQVSVPLLERLRANSDANEFRALFQEWVGLSSAREVDWLLESVRSVMKFHLEVESFRRFLRMPMILAEPTYVADLRRGSAFRALRRVGILNRLNSFVEECLDSILSALGHEELGKRGCIVNELANLDADLKARFVTVEELAFAVGISFRKLDLVSPASWWDRNCDIALVIGTFIHGLGNYEDMRNDQSLPFADKICKASQQNDLCKLATKSFLVASSAARQTFDDALEELRIKAELEVQRAVAEAKKAAAKREQDAEAVRKGETEIAAKNLPDTQVDDAFEYDGTDTHFVTLSRMHQDIQAALYRAATSLAMNTSVEVVAEPVKSEEDAEDDGILFATRVKEHHVLPMPDSRVLDHRLSRVLDEIERGAYGDKPEPIEANSDLWEKSNDVSINLQVRGRTLPHFVATASDVIDEYSGVGIGGNQCGTLHRSLNDGSDFGFGPASNQLAQVSYGTDAPRFLRGLGVPMNLTRFAVTGLVYAESSCVTALMTSERLRYYGREDRGKEPQNAVAESSTPEEPGKDKPSEVPSESKVQSSEERTEEPPAETKAHPSPKMKGPEKETDSSALPVHPKLFATLKPVDPVERIEDVYRANAKLRAHICLAVIFYGFPLWSDAALNLNSDLWGLAIQKSGLTPDSEPPERLFDIHRFREAVIALAPDVEVPDVGSLQNYVETILLPHCLRLCISGNGPTTKSARGSHGQYETAFGISIHPEPSQPHPTPLPDPCFNLREHSLEALGHASALLRRVRLLRSCRYICAENNMSASTIRNITCTESMRQLQDMPVWWCPWVHDVAILVQAATNGLFSIMTDRSSHAIFSPRALQQYLYSSVVGKNSAARHTPPEQVLAWTERQASVFPSLNQLERRLGALCSVATADVQGEARFDYLPMFDHGGWPRN